MVPLSKSLSYIYSRVTHYACYGMMGFFIEEVSQILSLDLLNLIPVFSSLVLEIYNDETSFLHHYFTC